MRKIKKIILTNFQKHDHLIVDLGPDINIITGETDTGKTCIFRALQWIHGMSNLSEKDYRREGTSETKVEVVYDDGFSVERIRSKSINRYVLKKEDCEDKTFDAVGKEIPEEIKDIIEIENINIDNQDLSINFAEQENLNFILDNSVKPSYRAKLFNKFTGNELIDKLFKYLNKEALGLSKSIKSYTADVDKQKADLQEAKTKSKELNDLLEIAKDLYSELKNDLAYYEELNSLSKLIKEKTILDDQVRCKLDDISFVSQSTIDEAKKLLSEFNKLSNIKLSLKSITESISATNELYKNIKITDTDFGELNLQSNKLESLKNINNKINEIINEIEYIKDVQKDDINVDFNEIKELSKKYNKICDIKSQINNIKIKESEEKLSNIIEQINQTENELKELLDKFPTCPTCGQRYCKDKK